eukprot:10729697-Prorocentrum_lima.AAC.1
MTSSLVGSEMCIRDRERGARLCARVCVCAQARARVFAAGAPALIGVSVSYTHLTLPTICSV